MDPNIELLNEDRNCFKVRFLIDVRGRCVSSHWQLPQPGLWPTPSRTSLPELAFAIAPGRQEHSASHSHSTRTFSHRCFTRTVEVTICIILERLFDRPRQLPHVKSYNSPRETQSCSRVTKMDYGRANGWQPRSFRNSNRQGKPACWGRPGVQPQLPGLPRHKQRQPHRL